MQTKTAQLLIRAADNLAEEAHLYEGYSGRCMYGDRTDGIVVESPAAIAALAAEAVLMLYRDFRFSPWEDILGEIDQDDIEGIAEDLVRDLGKIRWDNLGLQYIVY